MNILFVNNFNNLFEKADCGASQRSMCMLRALSQVGHVDVLSFVSDTVSNIPNVDVIYSKYIDSVPTQENRFSKFYRLFYANQPHKIYPINSEKKEIVVKTLSNGNYDLIVVRYIRYAVECGLLDYSDKLIIDIDDDQKQVVLMAFDKIKTLRNKLYNILYANTIDKLVKRIAKKVAHVYYSSPISHYPNSSFLPNISAYQSAIDTIGQNIDSRKILMVGRYDYYPNSEGLEHFINHIYPNIRSRINDAELHVVGKIFNEDLEKLCHQTEGVVVCGYVDDLVAKYAECGCAIVPIYYGSGTSVKLVEAMSLGCPTVSTKCGARGLHPDFLPNQDYMLANSDEAFANAVIRLLNDHALNNTISMNALSKTKSYYSTEAFNSIIHRSLHKLRN